MRTTSRRSALPRGARRVGLAATALAIGVGVVASMRATPALAEISLAGYGTASSQLHHTPGTVAPSSAASAKHGGGSFAISGSVAGLYPGASLPLVLTVTNPLKEAITVMSIATTVANASSLCVSGNLTVSAFQGSLAIAPGGSATTTVLATMAHAAPNACQGQVFQFQYSGTAKAA